MSFNGVELLTITNKGERMAKIEIHRRAVTLYNNIIWKHWLKHDVIIPWPRGWVTLHEMPDGSKTDAESSDPNIWYRPWLEKNCGKQCRAWDWRIGNGKDRNQYDHDMLHLKFRNSQHAFMFTLKYSR